MKGLFYVYTNFEELAYFLSINLIVPSSESDLSSRSLSRKFNNCLYLTKNRLSSLDIVTNCSTGISKPIILTVNINVKDKCIVWKSETSILVNDFISCNAIVSISSLNGKVQSMLVDDFHIFPSLVDKNPFECGNNLIEDIPSSFLMNTKSLEKEIQIWTKLEAFYACRFGLYNYVEKTSTKEKGKKAEILSKSNLDFDSFKYVSDISYSEFLNYLYEKDINLMDLSLQSTTLENDTFENCLKLIVSKKKENNQLAEIYRALISFKEGNLLDHLILNCPLSIDVLKEIQQFIALNKIDVLSIKTKFNQTKNRYFIMLLILCLIINKTLSEACDYISNYFSNDERVKEILSFYGLAKGMQGLDTKIKVNASILLFAYNKTLKIIGNKVTINVKNNQILALRNYESENLLNDGFDFKLYNRDEELCFINRKAIQALKNIGIPNYMLSKTVYQKNLKSNEIHSEFLRWRRK